MKSGVLAWGGALVALALVGGATAFAVEHDRMQAARIDALGRELVQARVDAAVARSVPGVPAAGVAAPPAGPPIDAVTVDSIAARVAAAGEARARAEVARAAEADAPSGETLAARADAQRTLESAVAHGRLRPADVLAIRKTLATDGEGRAELARQISVAINEGKIVPDDPRLMAP